MATLVNLCLRNQIDLPYYRLYQEEVCLFLNAGKLLDERMERLFESFDGYLESKLQGRTFGDEQKLVLSYLIKSQWANEQYHRYTILLTPDNNHFSALRGLEQAGLIDKHPSSTTIYPIYVADPVLLSSGYFAELREMFGPGFDSLDETSKKILGVAYRFQRFSKAKAISAKQASFSLWYDSEDASNDIRQFDAFYRKVRYAFNKLEAAGFIRKQDNARGYRLNEDFRRQYLL